MTVTSPRVGFVIGGVQKGGTTALAEFLARHPAIALPRGKEAHVFDDPSYDESWSVEAVDHRYARHFGEGQPGKLFGDATPIYVLDPVIIARIARYNPRMKWILILRHPVERAVSHYGMERARGHETWPFWPAMLLEQWRLRGHRASDLSAGSPLRRFSYRRRGDYARQLDCLYALFPRCQVLVLRNEELARSPAATLARVTEFLEVPASPIEGDFGRVFEGSYRRLSRDGAGWRVMRWLMRRELADAAHRHGIDWS